MKADRDKALGSPVISAFPDRREALKFVLMTPLAGLLADSGSRARAAGVVEDVSVKLPSGRTVRAALARPAAGPAPAVILFHEWWGLNDQIKTVAADLAAKQGYVALAVDLFNGSVTDQPDVARKQTAGVDAETALETGTAWVNWLRQQDFVKGGVGTVGWCFGGGWSLRTSAATPVEATVIYYGNVDLAADELAGLKGPVLGHFARDDQWINAAMVARFSKAMQEANKELTVHWYDADHAFANPTGARYDAADAATAWQRTLGFLRKTIG
jgi:carboxymethylenebutenolidase